MGILLELVGPFRFTASKRGLTGSVGGGGLRYQFLGGRRKSQKSKPGESAGGCLLLFVAAILALVYFSAPSDRRVSESVKSSPRQLAEREPEPPPKVDPVQEARPESVSADCGRIQTPQWPLGITVLDRRL